jgi:endosialidase-like protein
MTTQSITKSIGQSPLRLGFFLITLGLVCLALLPIPNALAVTPAPDGGYVGWNTAEGQDALFSLTSGGFNTAVGGHALYGDSTGGSNTGVGAFALAANSSGFQNVAAGQGALRYNTTGFGNTAEGYQALYHNTAGTYNTADGYQALYHNTTGNGNTAGGVDALYYNTTGYKNTAEGTQALYDNTTGSSNTAIGQFALYHNTTGNGSVAVGDNALVKSTGGGNIALGALAGINVFTASNVICIGADGQDTGNSCYIGNISGADAAGGDPVFVTSAGKLGTVTALSSLRFKDDIKPMGKASEAILTLKPVTFRYKNELDPKGTPQFGLVAEEVAKVNPDLVKRDRDGKLQTVRYEAVNAMLLNEFLKEHRKVEELEKARADEQREITELKQQVKAQAAAIQKVSDRLELRTLLPQVVDNR